MSQEALQMRVHGPAELPPLVYLPGLHGDWTLIGGFRRAIAGRVRFVEFTYPRTTSWSLQQYADAIEQKLVQANIGRGWLLAESFGSQIAWPLAAGKAFQLQGLILAGGFGRHPTRLGVAVSRQLTRHTPLPALQQLLKLYRWVARWRFKNEPEILSQVEEFIARRTELDRQAAVHRLQLIQANDPRELARSITVPIYGLTGLVDVIVPWLWARTWLRKNCPTLRDYRFVRTADHTVLSTGSRKAAAIIARWMGV